MDQVAVITGCGLGVGLGTALAFAKLNYRLVLVDSNGELLAEAAKLCQQESSKGHKPLEIVADLAASDKVASSVIEQTVSQFGQLDVLVNNVAAESTGFTKYDEPKCLELYHKIISANMHAVVYLCLAAFEPLSKSRGSIVNISSVLDDRPARFKFAHCMSKAAVTMLTKCLANDFAPQVRVNCVSPGPIAGSILDDIGGLRGSSGEASASCTLVRRMGEPDEVAKMIIFLSSKDKAAFITGSRVLVDGGYTLVPANQC